MYYADVLGGIVDLGERIIRRGERSEQWRRVVIHAPNRSLSFPLASSFIVHHPLSISLSLFSLFPTRKRARSLCFLPINAFRESRKEYL